MRATTHLISAICLTAALPLLGCGGAGGIVDEYLGPDPVTETLSVLSEPTLDGRVSVAGIIDFHGSITVAYTGDRGADVAPSYRSRQLYAFHLDDIPDDARIVGATLHLYQANVVGHPFSELGDIIVDHVAYVDDPGLDSYDGQDLARNIGTLSTGPELGPRSLDVTAMVAANHVAGHAWSQFRLRYWIEGPPLVDFGNDYVNFIDGEHDDFIGGERPHLDIVYER